MSMQLFIGFQLKACTCAIISKQGNRHMMMKPQVLRPTSVEEMCLCFNL